MLHARRAALALVAGCAALAGCAHPTPYQPLGSASSATAGGYSSQRIEPDRFRVSFRGNSLTARDTVENYLLFRASELTVQQGYDWFEEVHRDVDKNGRTVVDRPFGPGPYGGWGPTWNYFGAGYGWRSWSPFFGDPWFGSQTDIRTITSFDATAEIVMHHGTKPADNAHAFDARAVMANLGPQIRTPGQG